jgi:hypothetical protein
MKRLSTALLALACTCFLGTANAGGNNWQYGTISDHTTTPSGLMLMFADATVPGNCLSAAQQNNSWMIIPEANKTMIAAMLLAIAMNNRTLTVYTANAPAPSGGIGPSGYCTLTQVDPAN